jgi:creatinine amidohydrolase
MNRLALLILLIPFMGCLRPSEKAAAGAETGQREVPVEYTHLTPTDFRKRIAEAPIAYLPLGTLEWHGEHLPLGSDGLQSFSFMKDLARELGGIVLPMLYLGPDMMKVKDEQELYGMDYWLSQEEGKMHMTEQQLDGSAYWVPDELFYQIMEHSIKQLTRAGFKIIVAHGHGPSTQHVIRHWEEWEQKYDVLIYTCWSWNVRGENDEEASEISQREGLGIMTDHAASNESSLMMYYYPELVQMDQLPADTAQWPLAVAGQDPRLYASAELGQKAVEFQKERMARVLKKALNSLD